MTYINNSLLRCCMDYEYFQYLVKTFVLIGMLLGNDFAYIMTGLYTIVRIFYISSPAVSYLRNKETFLEDLE